MKLSAAMWALVTFGAAHYDPETGGLLGGDDDAARVVELVMDAEAALYAEVEIAAEHERREGKRFVPAGFLGRRTCLDADTAGWAAWLDSIEKEPPQWVASRARDIRRQFDDRRLRQDAARELRARRAAGARDLDGAVELRA